MIRSLVAFALAAVAMPASAVMISEGGQAAVGGGLTTLRSGPTVFVETFDTPRGCGLNFPVTIAAGSDYSITNTSVSGLRASPAGNTTCYLSSPNAQSSGFIDVDVADAFTSGVALRISYLGLYWGSIDDYNAFDFYEGDTLIGTLTGKDIRDALTNSGNQTAPGSNKYINLDFGPDELFTRFVMRSTQYAFEIDNLAVGIVETPEPAALGLFGLGLGLVALRRRRAR